MGQIDKAIVAQLLVGAQIDPARLLVALARDRLDQLVGQLGADELGPRPFHRGAELVEEMPHPLLAARQAVNEERAHERPAHPCAKADRVVDFRSRRDAVVDQPQRLAPHRFHQAVAAMNPSISLRTWRTFMPICV